MSDGATFCPRGIINGNSDCEVLGFSESTKIGNDDSGFDSDS